MKHRIWINVFLVVCIISFLYSGYQVYRWVRSNKETKDLEQGLYSDVVSTKEENQEEIVTIDFVKLKEINPDVIAWIRIDGTYINYPILQGTTDDYYLRRDIYQKDSVSGSIFVYSHANPEFLDDNTVIYGHNMKNGRMFANLHKIYQGELGTDVKIDIDTEKKHAAYQVYACYIAKSDINMIKSSFTQGEKKTYIENAINRSNIPFQQKIDYAKNMITLITCDSNRKQRVVVHAIEVE